MKIRSLGKNMAELEGENSAILYSNTKPVAVIVRGRGILKANGFDKTTSKHIDSWIKMHFPESHGLPYMKEVDQSEIEGLVFDFTSQYVLRCMSNEMNRTRRLEKEIEDLKEWISNAKVRLI